MPTTDPPDFVAARDHVVREVVSFARRLRASGVAVPGLATLTATEALAAVGLDDRERARAALHAAFVRSPRDTPAFDEQFPVFWYRLRTGLEATATADSFEGQSGDSTPRFGRSGAASDRTAAESAAATDTGPTDGEHGQSRYVAETAADQADVTAGDDTRLATYSAAGEGTTVEDGGAGLVTPSAAALDRFERALATLAGRRWTSGNGRIAPRRALRASLATGGVPLDLPTRDRAPTAFRVTVLVDVSRSVLDTLDRGFLLGVLDSLVDRGRGVRVFFFDTSIREVTAVFRRANGDPAAALQRAEVAWGGGTKIGDALATLRERWPDAVDRRTVTLVVSDGLDVGEVERLERGMSWLSRRSGPVLWLNPLAASAAYEPTCRGMSASLPYLDALFAFATPADLDEIARQLDRHGHRGPVGYLYDSRDRTGTGSAGGSTA